MTVVMTMVRNMPCKCKASKPYMTYRGLELTSVFSSFGGCFPTSGMSWWEDFAARSLHGIVSFYNEYVVN